MRGNGIDAILAAAAAKLAVAGVESPRREARLLLAYALGVRQKNIVTGLALSITPQILDRFEAALQRRVAREPFAYIVGSREFWSLDFAVGPGVLIPRPESETLIEEALRRFSTKEASLRVADFGTGSGCLLLAFLSERPNARGVGIDISENALTFAARNARALGLESRALFQLGNWTENLAGIFDAIFVNPPYIRNHELESLEPEVVRYEPTGALAGGPDGLEAYRNIAAGIGAHLKPLGCVFFELGEHQAEPVGAILAREGVTIKGTVCDLAGIPRCLVAGLDASRSGPKKELALETRSG